MRGSYREGKRRKRNEKRTMHTHTHITCFFYDLLDYCCYYYYHYFQVYAQWKYFFLFVFVFLLSFFLSLGLSLAHSLSLSLVFGLLCIISRDVCIYTHTHVYSHAWFKECVSSQVSVDLDTLFMSDEHWHMVSGLFVIIMIVVVVAAARFVVHDSQCVRAWVCVSAYVSEYIRLCAHEWKTR